MASSARSSEAREASSSTGASRSSAGASRGHAASRLLSLLIFAGLVTIVSLSCVPYGSVEPQWSALFEAAVFLLTASWAVEGALAGRWLARAQMPAAPGLALAAYALWQSLAGVSFDPYETRLVALEFLAYAAFLALLLRYADTERRLRALVYAVVAAGLASALFGLARQAVQRGAEGFVLEYLRPGTGYAQFVNKNHFAYLAEMALGLLLGIVAGDGVGRSKALIPLALALPVWAALVLSNSRGGIFAMLCQVIFLGATFGLTRADRDAGGVNSRGRTAAGAPSLLERASGSKAARAALVAALLAAVVVGMVWLGGDPLADRVASVKDEAAAPTASEPARVGRRDIWAATWRLFEDHPLAGVGFGGYWVAVSTRHAGSGESVPQQAHNDYLEALASGGLVGAGLVALFLFLLIRESGPRLREGGRFARASRLGALAGLCGVCVHSLVEFGLHVPSNAYAALALAAVAAARLKK